MLHKVDETRNHDMEVRERGGQDNVVVFKIGVNLSPEREPGELACDEGPLVDLTGTYSFVSINLELEPAHRCFEDNHHQQHRLHPPFIKMHSSLVRVQNVFGFFTSVAFVSPHSPHIPKVHGHS